MGQHINIFVAGAKILTKERDCIKVLANELSSKYQSRGISIIAKSYEHFKDDQKVYNQFIENEADIAIFIIDGKLGEKTEDEFKTAIASFEKKHHPEVIVFMRDNGTLTPEIVKAQETVKARLGDNMYYVEYKDLDDLKLKAEDRIDRVAMEASYSDGMKRLGIFKTLFCLAALTLIALGIWHAYHKPDGPEVKVETRVDTIFPEPLIFAGGGSVRNFIEDETGRNKNTDTISVERYEQYYRNSICIPLPSGSAWRILQEEVQHNNKRGNVHKFHTICLSAGKMDHSSKTKQQKMLAGDYVNRVEVNIGNDTLAVYISNDLFNEYKTQFNLKDNEITCPQLVSIMKKIKSGDINANVYTTTQTSGTLTSYASAVKANPATKFDSSLIHQYNVFYDYTSEMDITDPSLFLASTYYMAKDLKNDRNRCKRLILKTGEGPIVKPTCLYFLAYHCDKKDNSGKSLYQIDGTITDFLKEIDLKPNQSDVDAWERLLSGFVYSYDTTFTATINDAPANGSRSKSMR